MPNTFELIASTTLGSSASSIDFTSISSAYTDLCLKLSCRGTDSALDIVNKINFNGSTSGYSDRFIQGNGSAVVSGSNVWGGAAGFAGETDGTSSGSNVFANVEIYIPNYTSSNNKSYSVDSVIENNATSAFMHLIAGLWSNTAAITSISLTLQSGSFAANSAVYLYGVKNA
jgi:hypothetical protein